MLKADYNSVNELPDMYRNDDFELINSLHVSKNLINPLFNSHEN